MATRPLTEEMALRIGLAARELPGVALDDWLGILIRSVGVPLSPERCQRLRLARLRQTGKSLLRQYSDEQLRAALTQLRGNGFDLRSITPEPNPTAADSMLGSIRIACASNRGDRIDAAFGNCCHFLIYQVSAHDICLIDVREPDRRRSNITAAERLEKQVALVDDCHVVYALTIGASAAASLVRAGIHPLKVGSPQPAPQCLTQFQQVISNGPPPWLANLIYRSEMTSANNSRRENAS
ncbi:NifB/NifX family molybdenum-iron cluster-binding protein [Thalassolituus oleivorans]|uniref:NifB/NifX family molybdenum-iron cluster-binding protein n=1 Tax=Thalassolituus oleivorans TaxID=187493 RepID=UPI0023F4ED71|nr:dinitrogenase iron-molybdenum cofactor N-terminal domain-containing protein [Thalassolituus oleivorans]|tara:strand:- start:2331 stop:3047 length:717 start_codon:yes stop_codon:yes gene_type:complete